MSAPVTRSQRLAAQAAEAAEVRDWQTHPDVVALRVERARTVVEWFIWTGMALGLLFTMSNVQQFTAHTTGAAPGSLGWWAAWLLDPTVSTVLLGILLAERHTARWQIPMSAWTRAAKWGLLSATYVMNTWQSWAAGSAAGIVLHSVPPLVVFLGAEAVTDLQDRLTECVHKAHAHAAARAERKAKAPVSGSAVQRGPGGTQSTGTPTGLPPVAMSPPGDSPMGLTVPGAAPVRPLVPLVPASAQQPGPDRSGFVPAVGSPDRSAPTPRTVPADRPADRSADRSAPTPRTGPPDRPTDRSATSRAERSGSAARNGSTRTPRTDAELSAAVRQLAEQTGGTPSQYAIKQHFGVGSERAARLLAELDTTPNGTTPKEGSAP